MFRLSEEQKQAVPLLLVASVKVLVRNMGKQPNHPSQDLLEFR